MNVELDLFTITLISALVIIVSGVLYITETLMRKDGPAGRLWAIAFLAGILTVVCYLVWSVSPSAFLAVAVGNAGFVSTAGFIWLGCRAFNERPLRIPSGALATVAAIALIAALIPGPTGGDWAGAVPMFLGNALFATLGAIETRRGALADRWSAIGLTVVLIIEAVWFVIRTGVFVGSGPDSALFEDWFDSEIASILTITLTIVTVVTTSVLRASESNLRGQRDTITLHVALDGIMLPASFQSLVSTILDNARRNQETLCIIAVRIGDLGRISVAFGPAEAESVAAAWRAGVRRYAPSAAIVGDNGRSTLFAAFLTTSFADVRRIASIMHRRLLDDFATLGLSAMPVVGVGVALSDQVGYDLARLADAADEAARRSASSPDASVIRAEG
ncbi:hypothetical protein ACTU3I_09220 [Microbacterium sp. RD1]|uniref:hypothetical protein n=1 Tax=Microbacterium sp. RD1 TaxID=3457313 RepID=UPI003FA58CA9